MTAKPRQDALQDLVRISEEMGLYDGEFNAKGDGMKDEQRAKFESWYAKRVQHTDGSSREAESWSAWQAALALNAADRDVMRQAPEGWKWVPIEPTQAMCQAAQESLREWPKFPFRVGPAYKAMLAAAPTPPAEQQGEHCGHCGRTVVGSAAWPVREQQGEQEPVAWLHAKSSLLWGGYSVCTPDTDNAFPVYRYTSIAALRAKVEARGFASGGGAVVLLSDVLAEIDKLGGRA